MATATALTLLLLLGCGGEPDGDSVSVFAAASLREAFTDLADRLEADHPDAEVALNFAGSQQLVTHVEQGAEADVIATADLESMGRLGPDVGAEVFATNRLAIVVEPGNPLGVLSLDDLARPGVTLVLAAPEVPAGRYAAEVLDRAGVAVEPSSLEESVTAVVSRIALGEADAGIAYATDVAAAGSAVQGIAIPDEENVEVRYPIAVLDHEHDLAAAFADLVLSSHGRRVLARFGFLVPGRP